MSLDTSFVYLCPRCHHATLDISELTGGAASCRGCGWSGTNRDVIAAPFHHQEGSDEGMLIHFAGDFKKAFRSGMMQPLGLLLDKWGFFPENASPAIKTQLLVRYARAAANAMLRAIFHERQLIGDEEARKN